MMISAKEWSLNLPEIRSGTGRLTLRLLKILNGPFPPLKCLNI